MIQRGTQNRQPRPHHGHRTSCTMTQPLLYRYPFDEEGREILTLVESIAAMQELERQVNRLCRLDWRWCDLTLSVVERHPTYFVYEIHHHQKYTGQAIVMPFASGGAGVLNLPSPIRPCTSRFALAWNPKRASEPNQSGLRSGQRNQDNGTIRPRGPRDVAICFESSESSPRPPCRSHVSPPFSPPPSSPPASPSR